MRGKKQRATSGICKNCCFKFGVRCTMPYPPKLTIYKVDGITDKIDSECEMKVDVNWWVEDDPEWARECRENWKRMHRKKDRAQVIKEAKEDADFANLWNFRVTI